MKLYHFLTLLLVAAKLFGYFPYSWWWALSPLIVAFILLCFVRNKTNQ